MNPLAPLLQFTLPTVKTVSHERTLNFWAIFSSGKTVTLIVDIFILLVMLIQPFFEHVVMLVKGEC